LSRARRVTVPERVEGKANLLSGRSRRHKAGMGLCEAPGRSKPLHLGEPIEDLLPTCKG